LNALKHLAGVTNYSNLSQYDWICINEAPNDGVIVPEFIIERAFPFEYENKNLI